MKDTSPFIILLVSVYCPKLQKISMTLKIKVYINLSEIL